MSCYRIGNSPQTRHLTLLSSHKHQYAISNITKNQESSIFLSLELVTVRLEWAKHHMKAQCALMPQYLVLYTEVQVKLLDDKGIIWAATDEHLSWELCCWNVTGTSSPEHTRRSIVTVSRPLCIDSLFSIITRDNYTAHWHSNHANECRF